MSNAEQGWRVGSRFGPYQLKRLLGAGGMGEVYEAEDTVRKRLVALKLLSPTMSRDPVFRARMKREAYTAGRLTEPHVVPIHDYGEIDGQLYVDMRLINGHDLHAVLARDGAMPAPKAVAIVRQIAEALDAAHESEVIHRDVKPGNILVTDSDFAYLVDFGLARAASDVGLTTGTLGTWGYMAPERFTTDEVTSRADVYALACVLYECLTGSPPYRIDSIEAAYMAHQHQPIPRPSQARPTIPVVFDRIIAKGMAKNPVDRYASAGDLGRAAHNALTATDQTQADRIVAHSESTMTPPHPAEPPATRHDSPTHVTARRQRDVVTAARIRVGARPFGVAVNPGTVYVTKASDNSVSVINTKSRAVIATIAVGELPWWLAVDPNTGQVYATNHGEDTVSVIDMNTREVTATIHVGREPAAVALNPKTRTAYVTNHGENTVSVIDMDTRRVTATIGVGAKPRGIAVCPDTDAVYVAHIGTNAVSVIDPDTRKVTATIGVGARPVAVAVDPEACAVFVTNSRDDTVSVIDTGTHTVTATINVGKEPVGVAVDPRTRSVYVTNLGDNTVSVIDADTRTVIATVGVGTKPNAVAVDPGTGAAYTANRGDNTVSVIELFR
jgi:serine/threonine protein kinase, bacterial